ncbi:MAG: gamma-glutamyl-gamma-aminobutyrate hydrolase family protein [Buttiauxella noackiae]|nr:gamma-glutamyl-gamma-aminobutyrate hydrolase family protein [Buttiauxella noackiae]
MQTVKPALPRPVVAVICDRISYFQHNVHAVPETYLRALHEAAGVMPVLIPACPELLDLSTLLATVDGVLLPGSPSNVAAERYKAEPLPEETLMDLHRDETVFSLLPSVIAQGIPLMAICRGFQELNVFYGGTLHRAVHERADAIDHREGDHARAIEEWYEDSHLVSVTPGGLLATLSGTQAVRVNSLHHQGVDRLGKGLRIEAFALDGLIEAFTAPDAPGLVLGLQWHPEMSLGHSPLAQQLFTTFGDSCRRRQQSRLCTKSTGGNDEFISAYAV